MAPALSTMALHCAAVALCLLLVACSAAQSASASGGGAAAASAAAALERRAFFSSGAPTPKPVAHPIVQDAARFAIQELQKLSDSGIYSTLRLAQIHSAAAEVGDFHYAVHLKLALASPHFESGNATEDYELLVLEAKDLPGRRRHHKDERSIAIDEFPVMDEDAIEAFWVQMVDKRRQKRAQLFAKWTEEAKRGADPVATAAAEILMEARGIPPSSSLSSSTVALPPLQAGVASAHASPPTTTKQTTKKTFSLDELEASSTKQLRKMLLLQGGALSTELRTAITAILDDRLDKLERQETGHASHDGGHPTDEL